MKNIGKETIRTDKLAENFRIKDGQAQKDGDNFEQSVEQ